MTPLGDIPLEDIEHILRGSFPIIIGLAVDAFGVLGVVGSLVVGQQAL